MIQSIEVDGINVAAIDGESRFIARRITASGRYFAKNGKSIEYKVILEGEQRQQFLDLCGAVERKFFVELETEIRQEYHDGSGT